MRLALALVLAVSSTLFAGAPSLAPTTNRAVAEASVAVSARPAPVRHTPGAPVGLLCRNGGWPTCLDESGELAQLAALMMRAVGGAGELRPRPPGGDSCTTGRDAPAGTLGAVAGQSPSHGGWVRAFRLEIEDGLAIDGRCLGAEVLSILNDRRGWGEDGAMSFRQVDGDAFEFRIILASPRTVDALCAPIPTGGIFSCRNGSQVILNVDRWRHGADPFHGDVVTYRQYLVNHEVGHLLGHGHVGCPATGEPAPVMMQQTKTTAGCLPNGWPALTGR